jgi:hypothetical protein
MAKRVVMKQVWGAHKRLLVEELALDPQIPTIRSQKTLLRTMQTLTRGVTGQTRSPLRCRTTSQQLNKISL